jgi:hypothetical protein
MSREDLASTVHLPDFGSSGSSSAAQMAFEVQDGGPGRPPENWEQLLEDWMLVALPAHRAMSVLTSVANEQWECAVVEVAGRGGYSFLHCAMHSAGRLQLCGAVGQSAEAEAVPPADCSCAVCKYC